jgi:hypothetical protein
VVLAREHEAVARVALHDRISAVPAYIVKGVNLSLAVAADDYIETGNVISQPVTILRESEAVCSEKPLLGEDGSPFELIHLLGGVPRGRQSSDGRLIIGRGSPAEAKIALEEGHV